MIFAVLPWNEGKRLWVLNILKMKRNNVILPSQNTLKKPQDMSLIH